MGSGIPLSVAAADPFRVLGIPSTASAGEARRAYLSLVRLHHPDVNPGSRQFDAVVTAYRALGGVLPAGAPAQRVDVYA